LASPKCHAVSTGALVVGYSAIAGIPETWTMLFILFFGVFVDIDHLSVLRIKKLLKKDKTVVEGWVNYMHTWQGLLVLSIFCFFTGLLLPWLAYIIHMLVDGANRNNMRFQTSPLPKKIHRFYPEWLKYNFNHSEENI